MNKINISITVLLIFTTLNVINAQNKSRVIKPDNITNKMHLIVSGNSRTYFPLLKQKSALISLKGQGEIKIFTRVNIRTNANSAFYKIKYSVDGESPKTKAYNDVKKNSSVSYKEQMEGAPGELREIAVSLTGGEHTIQIWNESENLVMTRVIFTPTKIKYIEWVSYSPSEPNEPVYLISGDDITKYYRVNIKKPLKIKITGPTELRVLTRIENHFYMKGRINYRIQVNQDYKIKNTYQLNSIRSETAQYVKDGSKVPGKAREIIISVPEGIHIYELLPLDKDKGTVLARILFPKNDIKLGAK